MPDTSYGTSALRLLATVAKHPTGLPLDALWALHPEIKAETLRSTANRLVTKGHLLRIAPKTWQITEKGHRLLNGEGHLNNFRPPTKQEVEENKQRNVPWVHPIRARILAPTQRIA